MDRSTRIKKIVETVKLRQGVSVKELAEMTNVTDMTIRRDVSQLSKTGVVKLVSGAVVPDRQIDIVSDSEKYELDIQKEKRIQEKNQIGQMAASLIDPGDVVYIDIGTTTSNIIPYIPEETPVTIVCCTMNALMEAKKKKTANLILTGGTYRADLQMFESKEGEELLRRTRITKAFISAAGVNEKLGVTCIRDCEIGTKTAALHGALEKILVVDSSKFELVKPAFFTDLERFDTIVTDHGIPDKWKQILEKRGIRLFIA